MRTGRSTEHPSKPVFIAILPGPSDESEGGQPSPFSLGIQAFDLIRRHDVDLRLPVVKSDCAGDADGFPLNHGKSLIGRYCGPRRNESSERLIGVLSSEIDKCGTQWAGCDTDNATSHLDLFTNVQDGFRVFYHYWLVPTRCNCAEQQRENCDEKADSHCKFCILHCGRLVYDHIDSVAYIRCTSQRFYDGDKFVFLSRKN